MKIGDEVCIHGYIDEIRSDVVIIKNEGGYFGTVPSEVAKYIKPHIYGKHADVIIDEPSDSEKPNNCFTCKHSEKKWHEWPCGDCKGWNMYEPKTDCIECPDIGEYPECYDRTKWKKCPRRKGE